MKVTCLCVVFSAARLKPPLANYNNMIMADRLTLCRIDCTFASLLIRLLKFKCYDLAH